MHPDISKPSFCILLVSMSIFLLTPATVVGEGAEKNKEKESVSLAKEYFQRGIVLFDAGDYKGALENFEKSYELRQYDRIRYNIGVCHYFLGEYASALNALVRFLLEEGVEAGSQEANQAHKIIKKIEGKSGVVNVVAKEAGIEIRVDGVVFGKSPLPAGIYVEAGTHEIQAGAGKGREWKSVFTIEAGESKVIQLKLAEKPVVPAGSEGRQDGGDRITSCRELFYASLALTIAAIGGGTVSGAISLSKTGELGDLDRECEETRCNSGDRQPYDDYRAKRDEVYYDAELSGRMSTGFFIASGVMAASSLLFFFLWGPYKKSGGKIAAAPSPGPMLVGGNDAWSLTIRF